MTWETVPMRGLGGVTCAWRKPGGQGCGLQLAVVVSSSTCHSVGLRRGHRVLVQIDRAAGKMRFLVSEKEGRKPQWKRTKRADIAAIYVPMPHLGLAEPKPAQAVRWEEAPGELTIKLPPWAVDTKPVPIRPAIPLRDGHGRAA